MQTLEDLRQDNPDIRADFTIDQKWTQYGASEHEVWRTLFRRQSELLQGRACNEFLDGLHRLGLTADGIPDFETLSDSLERLTGWRLVAVPSLVPDAVFFAHLANRRFPAGRFIRKPSELDYIQEPDVFHDVFGHAPMLAHPVFADYMQAYGNGGLRALNQFHALKQLARLYWYTVEFGLITTKAGLRIYGSGIVSSAAETVYALENAKPHRIGFDIERVMRTDYRIDDLQPCYFVINSFEALFAETYADFANLYERLQSGPTYEPETILPEDRICTR